MAAPEIIRQYEERLEESRADMLRSGSQQGIAGAMLGVAALATLILGINAVRHRVPVWWPVLPAAVGASVIPQFRRARLTSSRSWRLKRFYDRSIRRAQDLWAGEGVPGDEFRDAGHPYAQDLNIFGNGSLFELLCIARTAIGRKALAGYLLTPPEREETLARQEAVRELRLRTRLREEIAMMGEFEAAESRPETFADWLNQAAVPFSPAVRVAAAISSTAVLAIALAGVLGLVPWAQTGMMLVPFLLVQSIAGLMYRDRVREMMEALRGASLDISILREGLQLLERQRFECAKLSNMLEQVRGASRNLRKLDLMMSALHVRNKDWFYQTSLLLMAATQLCAGIEQWRLRHGAELRNWIDVWGEFEALNALANYAWENPANTFPELIGEGARFEALDLGHPLLQGETCVCNDVRLDAGIRFFVISGSNMSGKSSLLRAIGLNAVLAFAGAPVRARQLRLSQLAICASISVVDSLLNGKSKFLAEVERVRQSIQSAEGGRPVLFLIDEIFSGTNSRDRRAAAEAVVRTLVERGAIGALSTHDMSLTEIAEAPELHGANVHLGARDGADPMSFDYRLKPGITTETNALAIARMAGVPV